MPACMHVGQHHGYLRTGVGRGRRDDDRHDKGSGCHRGDRTPVPAGLVNLYPAQDQAVEPSNCPRLRSQSWGTPTLTSGPWAEFPWPPCPAAPDPHGQVRRPAVTNEIRELIDRPRGGTRSPRTGPMTSRSKRDSGTYRPPRRRYPTQLNLKPSSIQQGSRNSRITAQIWAQSSAKSRFRNLKAAPEAALPSRRGEPTPGIEPCSRCTPQQEGRLGIYNAPHRRGKEF